MLPLYIEPTGASSERRMVEAKIITVLQDVVKNSLPIQIKPKILREEMLAYISQNENGIIGCTEKSMANIHRKKVQI